jgi:hypothetical protein
MHIKKPTLSLRIDGDIKEGLRRLAEAERRSITSLIEIMTIERCKKRGIKIDWKVS